MKHLGHYEIIDLIGDGGMGAVYRAIDPRFGRHVAIKVLHSHLRRDPEVLARFKTEAVIEAKLNHPHIVTVYDFLEADEHVALIMQYVPGQALDGFLASRGRLPWELAVELTQQILEAIHYAHRQGLVHRDLKPSNILVEETEDRLLARVTDFGVAKVLGDGKHRTETGARIGTLAYMSPEQMRRPQDVDGRSDIYAIGVMLYEMLTGEAPFAGATDLDVMQRIVGHEFVAPRVLNGAVPEVLERVVLRAMALEVEDRYGTCGEFRRALGGQRGAPALMPREDKVVRHPAPPPPDARRVDLPALKMIAIPAGRFTMGSPKDEFGRNGDETQHEVELTRAFEMSAAAVTQAQWHQVMGTNPSLTSGAGPPVERVNWYDAVEFCIKLSELAGLQPAYRISGGDVVWNTKSCGYRLPTEAEWEYACRAGTTTAYHTGSGESDLALAGWYSGNAGSEAHPVGNKTPNAWGLYDMHGNVWEWCWDWYGKYGKGPHRDPQGAADGSDRVIRGGSWDDDAGYCRAAFRDWSDPSGAFLDLGFRVVRSSVP